MDRVGEGAPGGHGTCSTCPFYAAFPGPPFGAPQCRADSPRAVPMGQGIVTFWPEAHDHWWCGKHPDRQPRSNVIAKIA